MKHLTINYPGLEEYRISPSGEVIGKDGVRKISQRLTSRGYMKVGLYVGGKKRSFSVARLVALTYVPTKDITLDVDHIDGNKLNNHYTNLQWLTRSENVSKAFQQGRVGSRKGKISGKLTGLYLSHESVEILRSVDNKSRFVDDLIKNSQLPEVSSEGAMFFPPANQVRVNVSDLLKTETPDITEKIGAKAQESVVTTSELGELPCCANPNKPCKHWVWDVTTGEGYVNSLSGRFMEAE